MGRPSIVFVFRDQQRYDTMGCAGNSAIRTPSFDRLAAEGVFFTQAFSGCPICSAYRGQVLTGRYSHANGVVDNEYALFDDEVTLAHALGGAGYRTAFVGKWHLGYGPYTPEKRFGFDYMAASNCLHSTYYEGEYWENEKGPLTMDDWFPIYETDLAIRFLEDHIEREPDTPFFLGMSWEPPHWPYGEYPDEYDMYEPGDMPVSPNVPEQLVPFARQELADYYGNITGMDAQMGRVLGWLEKNGLRENTIVCYSSDHGDHLWSHGYGKPADKWLHHTKRASKGTPYDESVHIPFLLSWPARVKAGSTTDVLFNSVDVMPTLLSLAGVEIPERVQGTDLSHAVLGSEGEEPDSVYLQILGSGWPTRREWVGCWRGLRTKRWVYARWLNDEQVWLFDRENDPYEMKNLAGKPEHADTEKELRARLDRWMKETDDPFDTGKRDPKYGMLELDQKFTSDRWDNVTF
jgi:arylsulfatase A-like enzyme